MAKIQFFGGVNFFQFFSLGMTQERERGVGNLREEGLFISQQPDAAERKLVWTINWFTQPNSQLNPSKGPLPELE